MEYNFFALQATYTGAELAFFKNNRHVATLRNEGIKASSHLVELIDALLAQHMLTLDDLNFFAVDKGPGAFTSLRVALATINGISFARHSNLIGVDGLSGLIHDAHKRIHQPATIVALLNAYSNEVYYAFKHTSDSRDATVSGCKNISDFLALIATVHADDPLVFTGNAYPLHQGLIETSMPNRRIEHDAQNTASAQAIGELALEHVQKGALFERTITPHYMKSQFFAVQKSG